MRHFVETVLGTSLILIAALVSGCNDTSTTFLASGGVQTNFTVTPSASDGHETISPSTSQSVASGATQTFVLGVSSGYTLNTSVGGSCAAGSWNSNVYTTGAITANCTVIFSAAAITYTVTPSSDGNETVSPSTAQTVNDNSTTSFTVTANAGYTVLSTVGGNCATGSWNGNVYTTGTITSNCTLSFSAATTGTTFAVTPSASDGHETVSPSGAQTVISGSTPSFTLTPSAGYTINSAVAGTCPAGSWSGLVYTTGSVTADCTVIFSAVVTTYTVTPSSSDGHETIAPDTVQTVDSGATQSFTVTADAGYTLNTSVGGTCASGSWSGGVYTTGAITSNCSVTFSAASRADAAVRATSKFSTSPRSALEILRTYRSWTRIPAMTNSAQTRSDRILIPST